MSKVLHIDPTGQDLSPYRTNMTRVGKVTLGGRPKYDGSTGYLINNTANWRSSDQQGTIMAWVYRDVAGATQTIISSADQGTGGFYRWTSFIHSSNTLRLLTAQVGVTTQYVTGGTTIGAGTWFHVAIVSNSLASSLFVNGNPETVSVVSGANNGDWLADITLRDNVVIGAEKYNVVASYFNGMIDDLQVYDEALSASWLKAYYEQTRQHRLAV